jgi:hypothetical protein
MICMVLLLTLAFFVRVVAEQQQDNLRKLGHRLSILLIIIALSVPALATIVQTSGNCPIEKVWRLLDSADPKGK